VTSSFTPEVIGSPANPTIAFVRSLGQRDHRAAERAFVVEGMRAVRDALETGATPRLILLRADRAGEDVASALALPAGAPIRYVAPRLFDRLSDVQTPQGLLAVFPLPEWSHDAEGVPLVLVLDRLRDPGNLGTLLRSAAGAGVTGVYLTAESVDPWNPKVVRAGMGAHFRVPVFPLDAQRSAELRTRIPLRVAAQAGATRTYDAIDWTTPVALIVGGETEGVSPALAQWSTDEVAIPLQNGVESLNAAVAGSVMLFEAARQRRSTAASDRL
jgi:TrmH family RNA methyltransferase